MESRSQLIVTMPALYRPEILATTLWSFERGLFCQFSKRTLIINLDPVGVAEDLLPEKRQRIFDLASQHFDQIISRASDHPSFSVAVQWIWQQAVNRQDQSRDVEYLLHLEDDWVLNRAVPVAVVDTLLSQPKVGSVRLQRQKQPVTDHRLSLNPVFLHIGFIRQALPLFRLDKDPEKQFSMQPLLSALSDWRHLVMPDGQGGWVSDIGVHWRKSRNLEKVSELGTSRWRAGNSGRIVLARNWMILKFKLFIYRTRVRLITKGRVS